MRPGVVVWLTGMAVLAIRIWCRDTAWTATAPDAPALLLVFPACFALGRPWHVAAGEAASPLRLLPGGALLLAGTLIDSTLAFAVGWALAMRAGLEAAGVRAAHPRPGALCALAALGFPWVATDLSPLSGPLRASAASAAAAVLSSAGVHAAAEGSLIRLPHLTLFVDEGCSGVGALQVCLLVAALLQALPGSSPRPTALVVAGAAALAFATNVLRLIGVAALALGPGPAAASGPLHAVPGLAAVAGAAMVLCCALGPDRPCPKGAR